MSPLVFDSGRQGEGNSGHLTLKAFMVRTCEYRLALTISFCCLFFPFTCHLPSSILFWPWFFPKMPSNSILSWFHLDWKFCQGWGDGEGVAPGWLTSAGPWGQLCPELPGRAESPPNMALWPSVPDAWSTVLLQSLCKQAQPCAPAGSLTLYPVPGCPTLARHGHTEGFWKNPWPGSRPRNSESLEHCLDIKSCKSYTGDLKE